MSEGRRLMRKVPGFGLLDRPGNDVIRDRLPLVAHAGEKGPFPGIHKC